MDGRKRRNKMAKKPVTTYNSPQDLSDPRKFKKFYLKMTFHGNKEAYNFFVQCWDEAKAEDFTFIADEAWIKFRKHWEEDDSGYWKYKLHPQIPDEEEEGEVQEDGTK